MSNVSVKVAHRKLMHGWKLLVSVDGVDQKPLVISKKVALALKASGVEVVGEPAPVSAPVETAVIA